MPKKQNNTEVVEQTAQQTVSCKNFDVSRFYLKPVKQPDGIRQEMMYPKYLYDKKLAPTKENFEKHGQNLILVTEPIQLTKGGIPQYNAEYHGQDTNSAKRAYFYIPRTVDDVNSEEFFKCIESIDARLTEEINEDKNRTGILCKLDKNDKVESYKKKLYQNMVLDVEKTEKYDAWQRIKCKFATEYSAGASDDTPAVIQTQIYVGDNEDKENVNNIDDVEKYFRWGCTAQFVIHLNKVWISKAKAECGAGMKCLQIGVTKLAPERSSLGTQFNKRLFASSGTKTSQVVKDDDEDTKPVKNSKQQDSDDEEESEAEDEKPVQKNKGKKVVQDSDDEEESEAEDEKPVQKNKGKKVVQDSDDEEESEAEDEKPVQKSKGKKVVQDSDDDDDEQPVSKSKGKKVVTQDSDDEESEEESDEESIVKSSKNVKVAPKKTEQKKSQK